jgi:hypothetical protein
MKELMLVVCVCGRNLPRYVDGGRRLSALLRRRCRDDDVDAEQKLTSR